MSKTVALPWYHRADWSVLHAEFADRDAISPCYDAWKASAMARETKWRHDGYDVQRVELRPDAFRAWCSANGRVANHASRRAYADEMLAQRRLSAQVAQTSGKSGESTAA